MFLCGDWIGSLIHSVIALVQQFGFTERKAKGSHRIFYREGTEEIINLQPSKDRKAKPYQVKQVRDIVTANSL